VDEAVFDVPAALRTVADDLARQGGHCRRLHEMVATYRQQRQEVDADPGAPPGVSSLLTRSAVRVGLRALEDIPFIGAFAAEVDRDGVAQQAEQARQFLARRFTRRGDLELLISPVAVLSPVFLDDLRSSARDRPVALFFDTYERTGEFLDRWLLDLLAGAYGDLPSNLIIIIAGRHPLDDNNSSDYLGIRTHIELEVFTDTEARQLLASRGVTNDAVVTLILTLSGRLPVWVATLAESRPETVEAVEDPSESAVDRFLKWETDSTRRVTALRGALPR